MKNVFLILVSLMILSVFSCYSKEKIATASNNDMYAVLISGELNKNCLIYLTGKAFSIHYFSGNRCYEEVRNSVYRNKTIEVLKYDNNLQYGGSSYEKLKEHLIALAEAHEHLDGRFSSTLQ